MIGVNAYIGKATDFCVFNFVEVEQRRSIMCHEPCELITRNKIGSSAIISNDIQSMAEGLCFEHSADS
jgi:hypothetical protein